MKRLYILFLIISPLISSDVDYHLHLYSINRLSDGGVIKIPFRLADINFNHQKDNIEVSSRISFEYKPKFSQDVNGNMKFKNKVDEEIFRLKHKG